LVNLLAEKVRFELTELLHSTVFKTVAFNHSATFPFGAPTPIRTGNTTPSERVDFAYLSMGVFDQRSVRHETGSRDGASSMARARSILF
jgi:hypothetical protein